MNLKQEPNIYKFSFNKENMESLHPGAKWKFRIEIYLGLIIFLAFFFVPFIASTKALQAIWIFLSLAIFFFIILIGEIFIRWAYRNWKYEFTKEALKIEKGVIVKRYKSIPYERIQNIDITRGIIARMIGFSTVDIQTAGYSVYPAKGGRGFSEGHIPAVSIARAEQIREFLMKRISHNRQGL